jgi:hypothetical protein
MGKKASTLLLLVAATALSALTESTPVKAGGLCSSMTLSCENGRTYPFCPIAVSDAGEVVTGHLVLSARNGVHMRLVPMGAGYRYIGRDVWFDGVRSDAVLYFGKSHSVACTVQRD